MNPGIRLGKTPPFYEIGEYRFQEMCQDLFEAEASISTCNIYGTRGQKQYGVDLISSRADGDGIEVGQCKCYEKFSTSNISEASEDFFSYWDRWSNKRIQRFILFVACNLDSRQHQDEIIRQRELFLRYGIVYETWSGSTIRNRLQTHPEIVRTYLSNPEHWLREICGFSPQSNISDISSLKRSVVEIALINQNEQLLSQISNNTEKQLEQQRTLWRKGNSRKVIEWVKQLKTNQTQWSNLPPATKAKILRFEAGLELDINENTDRAKQLVEEAKNLAPEENDVRIRALITYREKGQKPAIEILSDQDDPESLNLLAGFYLELGNIKKCNEILEKQINTNQANAETYRLKALLHLACKEINSAQLAIQKAKELEPKWENIKLTSAIIDYYSAILPAAIPDGLIGWPNPIDLALVRQDDQSLKRLEKAARVFKKLTGKSTPRSEEKLSYETWYLACLLNHADQQKKGVEYCRRVLKKNPTHFHFIAWIIGRHLDVDLKESELKLSKLVKERKAEAPEILSLVSCYLYSDKSDRALQLLESTKNLFEKNNLLAWSFWYSQALLKNGKPQVALTFIDESSFSEELKQIRTHILIARSEQSQDFPEIVTHLENSYQDTNSPYLLLELCRFKARLNQWDDIITKKEQLIKMIPTSESVRLVAIAFYNTKQFKECIEFLEQQRNIFRNQRLTPELRRLRIDCLHALRYFPEAIEEAESLTQEYPQIEHLIGLFQYYRIVGYFDKMMQIARKLANYSDIQVDQLLFLAQSIQLEDQPLAIDFWRRAVNQGIPDNLIPNAYLIGHQLGLEKDLGELAIRMAELGKAGAVGVQMFHLKDIKKFLQEDRQRSIELTDFYFNTKTPIHFLSASSSLSLTDFYHGLPTQFQSQTLSLNQFPLLSFYGGRRLFQGFPQKAPNFRLHLDITAILLAAHLEVLHLIEKCFSPLRIPASVLPTLVQIRDKKTPNNPELIKIYNHVLDLIDQNLIKVIKEKSAANHKNQKLLKELGPDWILLFEAACLNEGYLVDNLPLMIFNESLDFVKITALSKKDYQYIIDWRCLIETLWKKGPLSEEKYRTIIQSHPIKEKCVTLPEKGNKLYFDAGVLLELGYCEDFLDLVCQNFAVHISNNELNRIKAEIAADQNRQETIQWLGNLIKRINQGVEAKTYEIISGIRLDVDEQFDNHLYASSFEILQTLMSFDAQKDDVVWSDDRAINKFARRDADVPIITILEVLKCLVACKGLSKSEYYQKILALKAANFRYIPVHKDEILYHINQARVDDRNVLLPTTELKILQKYVAICLVENHIFQKPSEPFASPDNQGELPFVSQLHAAIVNSIAEVWLNNEDTKSCEARANWLIENLYADFLGMATIIEFPIDTTRDRFIVTISLAGFFLSGIVFQHGINKSANFPTRRQYFDWIYERILRKRFDADPLLLPIVADEIKKIIIQQSQQVPKGFKKVDVVYLFQNFYMDLPTPIKDEIQKDQQFLNSIGLETIHTVPIADLSFKQKDFWRAARQAINGKKATISIFDSKRKVTFIPFEPEKKVSGFYIKQQSRKELYTVEDNFLLMMLKDSPSEREKTLRKYKQWFDFTDKEFEKFVAKIVTMEVPGERLLATESRWKESTNVFYYQLDKKFKDEQKMSFRFSDLIPPKGDGLLRHFGIKGYINSELPFSTILTNIAEVFIREKGLQNAIVRLWGFPTPLPKAVIEDIGKLESHERKIFLVRLYNKAYSPVSKVHCFFVLKHFCNEYEEIQQLTKQLITEILYDDYETDFQAFNEILNWVKNEFVYWQDVQDWPSRIRLAVMWAHSNQLFNIFKSFNADPLWILETFKKGAWLHLPPELLERHTNEQVDIAYPLHFNYYSFLLTSLSYGVGDNTENILGGELLKCIEQRIFLDENKNRILNPQLYKDFTLTSNSLDSFLYNDIGKILSTYFKTEIENLPTPKSLRKLAQIEIDELKSNPFSKLSWLHFQSILGSLPIYEELENDFKSILAQVDFCELLQNDQITGLSAFYVSTAQAIHLNDENLNNYLRDQIIKLANQIELMPINLSSEENFDFILIDSALNLAIASNPIYNRMEVLAEILLKMISVWKSVIPRIKPLIQRLCEELPISQAKHLWKVLYQLRVEVK